MTLATLRTLLARELAELEKILALCTDRLARRHDFRRAGTEDILADSVASCLHSFYSGIENLLGTIATELDELPQGPQWHKRLLVVMTLDVPGVRPAVLSEKSRTALDEFRAFRHLFRNLYTHALQPDRVFDLCGRLGAVWGEVRADLKAFIDTLGELDGQRRP